MAILWAGGEDIDFPGSALTIDTSSSYFAANYARCAIHSLTIARSTAFSGGAITSAWLRFYLRLQGGAASLRLCGLSKSSAASGQGLWIATAAAGSGNKIALSKHDGTTLTQLAAESGLSGAGNNQFMVDMHLQSYGANAYVDVYVNGASIIAYGPGDVTTSGVTDLDCVSILGLTGSQHYYMSEIIVADEDTRAFRLVTMAPNGDGTTTDWTGDYSTVNATTISDTTPNYTDTVSLDQQFNLLGLPTGTFRIAACQLAARLAKSASGTATSVAMGVKNGANTSLGSNLTLTTAYTTYTRLMTVDPTTSGEWAPGDMAGLQTYFRSA